MVKTFSRMLEKTLETISIALLVSLAVVVILAVAFRKGGASLVWYDEVAVVQLAWLTYYGSALAALRRSHLGFSGVFFKLPVKLRLPLLVFSEVVVIGFFAVIGWAGWYLLEVFGDEALISLPWVPLSFTQSVIPIGAALFVIAELLSLPDAWQKARAGLDFEALAIEEAIEEAKQS